MVNERIAWDHLSLIDTTSQSLPSELLENEILDKIFSILSVIDEYEKQIGKECYEITVQMISERLNIICSLAESSVYRYLRKAKDIGLVEIETKIVNVYKQTSVIKGDENILPRYYIIDQEGEEISPSSIPEEIYMEIGEKTLKAFRLTKKGHAILRLRI